MNSELSNSSLLIRKAAKEDTSVVLGLIKELAVYEKLLDEVTADEKLLSETLFGESPSAEVILAFYENQPAGMAI
ncbi:MAG: GNAT family N-acetyltransferase, partial [Bacillota bacterium]